MQNEKLRELSRKFFDRVSNPNEVALYDFLLDYGWVIYDNYQKMSMIQLITTELENRDFEVGEIPQNIIDDMAHDLTERIYDEDRFSSIIEVVFEDYAGDLQEYAVED